MGPFRGPMFWGNEDEVLVPRMHLQSKCILVTRTSSSSILEPLQGAPEWSYFVPKSQSDLGTNRAIALRAIAHMSSFAIRAFRALIAKLDRGRDYARHFMPCIISTRRRAIAWPFQQRGEASKEASPLRGIAWQFSWGQRPQRYCQAIPHNLRLR